MTPQQRRFAAEHHNLIYAFLREKGWAEDEYYDIAAFGFLRAVIRYLTETDIRKYAFSTVAWRAMTQSISSYHRAEARRLESERSYVLTMQAAADDPYSELEANLLYYDLLSMSTEEQRRLAVMRRQGYSIAETARRQGMSPARVWRLLRALYQAYLQLYKD